MIKSIIVLVILNIILINAQEPIPAHYNFSTYSIPYRGDCSKEYPEGKPYSLIPFYCNKIEDQFSIQIQTIDQYLNNTMVVWYVIIIE